MKNKYYMWFWVWKPNLLIQKKLICQLTYEKYFILCTINKILFLPIRLTKIILCFIASRWRIRSCRSSLDGNWSGERYWWWSKRRNISSYSSFSRWSFHLFPKLRESMEPSHVSAKSFSARFLCFFQSFQR